jgi:DNA helicase-2/ATP-dependent DNA helicase PcrA
MGSEGGGSPGWDGGSPPRRSSKVEEILSKLNGPQRDAVLHKGGPLLILAGAGSGKTRIIVHRIAYMIAVGEKPWNILALTFTNKAADEMRSRIRTLLREIGGPDPSLIWIGTFHSICARILRADGKEIGIGQGFSIYDESDTISLIRSCIEELGLDWKWISPESAANAISRAKERLLDPSGYWDSSSKSNFARVVTQVFELYQKRLRENNALDFDDLISETVRLFREAPHLLERYQDRFHHILVDEYQDTNHAQYVFIKLLAQKRRNLFVVGDDDQSIYGWRGADIRNILEFERDFPDARVIRLEQNYRSTKRILSAASSVIRNNMRRKPKSLWTENEEGDPVTVAFLPDEGMEAFFIASSIKGMVEEEGRKLGDFAVLYRTHAQSRAIEEAMRSTGIPYMIVGGTRFYDRKEIKDIISYLRVICNPSDSLALMRVINEPPRGIGKGTAKRIVEKAVEWGVSVYEAMGRVDEVDGIGAKQARAIKGFREMMEWFMKAKEGLRASELISEVIRRTGYLDHILKGGGEEAISRAENVRELISAARDFEEDTGNSSLEAFLERVSLLTKADEAKEDGGAVLLMTLHCAKGLEFPVVFIAGLEEGLCPHINSMRDEERFEEERRLCYVGMTRAKERLILTCAEERKIGGERISMSPSRFIEEASESGILKIRV